MLQKISKAKDNRKHKSTDSDNEDLRKRPMKMMVIDDDHEDDVEDENDEELINWIKLITGDKEGKEEDDKEHSDEESVRERENHLGLSSTMHENTRKEIGMVFFEEYQVFAWKIPNASSLEHRVDFVVQSPPFVFEDASWILKMYPYGQTEYSSSGYIDIIIEKLDSQDQKYRNRIKIYCEDIFGMIVNNITRQLVFDKQCTHARAIRFMQNLQDCQEKWKITPNDTFTLVCKIEKTKEDVLVQTDLSAGQKSTTNPEIGELLMVGKIGSYFFKMCDLHKLPRPIDNLQSMPFSFASASWTIYLYFRVEQSSEQTFSMVLERRESEIPEHNILIEMEASFYTIDRFVDFAVKSQYKYFVFNSYCTRGQLMHCPLQELHINGMPRCIHFNLEMKTALTSPVSATKMANLNLSDNIFSRCSTVTMKYKALQDFKEFYLKKEDCDVTIKVNGQEFPAHKAILQARSPVLASAFRCNMREKETGIIDIKDCDPIDFSDFLCYLYCGELQNISVKNVHSLFVIADKYDVSDLKSNCLEFMEKNLTLDTFCDFFTLALQYSENKLIKLATDFFVKNVESIIVSTKWQSFILQNPIVGNELFIKAVTSMKK